MSENKCLVTKLGASVSGDFPKLGELIIPMSTVGIHPSTGDLIRITGSGVELRGSLEFSDDTTSANSGVGKYLKTGGTGQLVIKNKYSLTKVEILTDNAANITEPIDVKDISYNKNLDYISLTGSTNYPRLKGDIECLTGLSFSYVRMNKNPELTGDIKAFAYAMKCEALKQSVNPNFNLTYTDVYGSIEDLVKAIRALQVADGEEPSSNGKSPAFNVSGTRATFQGQPITYGAGKTLAWTATKITFNRVTITDVTE